MSNKKLLHHSQHAKNQLNLYIHLFSRFYSLTNYIATPIFENAHLKISEITFSSPEFSPACRKISSFHLFILEIQSILESCDQTGHAHFWLCSPKHFSSTFILCECISTSKKSDCFIDLLWRYDWLKNPTMWLAKNILVQISGTKVFQIWDLWRNTTNDINFYYRTNLVKPDDKNNLKKPCFCHFWSIFPILGAKTHSRKSGSVMHNLIWISSTMPKFRQKLMMQFQEKTWTEEQTEGRKDGQTLFHRTLPATIGGIINCMEFCCHCFDLYYGDHHANIRCK